MSKQEALDLILKHLKTPCHGGSSMFYGISKYSHRETSRHGLETIADWLSHEGVHLNPTKELHLHRGKQYRPDNKGKDSVLYLDFDIHDKNGSVKPGMVPVTADEFIQALKDQGFTVPTYWIESSTSGNFHVVWLYTRKLPRQMYTYVYEHLGSDPKFTNSLMLNPFSEAHRGRVHPWTEYSDQDSVPTIESPEALSGFRSPAIAKKESPLPIPFNIDSDYLDQLFKEDSSKSMQIEDIPSNILEPSTSFEPAQEEFVPSFDFGKKLHRKWIGVPLHEMVNGCNRKLYIRSVCLSVMYTSLRATGEILNSKDLIEMVIPLVERMKEPLTSSDIEFVVDGAIDTFIQHHEQWINAGIRAVIAAQSYRVRRRINSLLLYAAIDTVRAEVSAFLRGERSHLTSMQEFQVRWYLNTLPPNLRSGLRNGRASIPSLVPILLGDFTYVHDEKWLTNLGNRSANMKKAIEQEIEDPFPTINFNKAVRVLALVSRARRDHIRRGETVQGDDEYVVFDFMRDSNISSLVQSQADGMVGAVTARDDAMLSIFIAAGGRSHDDKARLRRSKNKYHVSEQLASQVFV